MVLLFFSQFVITPTGCIINAMDLKLFSQHYSAIKSRPFKEFSNQSNVDKLVINSMSGCNYKITNLITITNLTIA